MTVHKFPAFFLHGAAPAGQTAVLEDLPGPVDCPGEKVWSLAWLLWGCEKEIVAKRHLGKCSCLAVVVLQKQTSEGLAEIGAGLLG